MNGLSDREAGRPALIHKRPRAGGPSAGLLALGLAAGAVSAAQAADLGSLKVLSASGEPLRAEITVNAATPQEAGTLQAAIAPRDVYRQTQLEYSEALANLTLRIEDRPDGRKVVSIASAAPLDVHVLDLLVELTWNMGRFIRQYTFILDVPTPKAQAAETQSTPAALEVKPGDTLFGIAGRLKPEGASIYQTLAALLRANPQAFVDGNMNRLRAGASLSVPGADDVGAIDSAQAAALFASQAEAFEAYRQRVAGGARQVPAGAAGGAESRGDIASSAGSQAESGTQEGDALKLSSGGKETAAGGEQTTRDRLEEERDATAKAMREAQERVEALQGNVEAMRGLLEAQNETLAKMEQQARERAADTAAGQPATPAGDAAAKPDAAAPAAPAQAPATAGEPSANAAAPATAEAAPAGEPEARASLVASVAGKVREHSVAVLGAIVAVLAALLGALALRRRSARAEREDAREAARVEDENANEEADALPPAEGAPVNHLRDWDDIPPFPIPDTLPPRAEGEPDDYPDDDEPEDSGRPAAVAPAAAVAAFGLDLSLDAPAPAQDKPRHTAAPGIDLDTDLDAPAGMAAKLDLAKAYADMGDRAGARELLEEVLRDGDADQRERARALLASW
ncbi:hypothetical protein EGT29_16025 [Pigmentiphaga sp. H8]|uniref:FimV/HubP family polar landmark protein n=1 Tax=Pigmentiphaga sp. H8 TaxID=2488560 RepID=UPI000F5B4FD1|nr:FimV/HubP family polar landmark protein [Pigmentiphaga sp. H8]AZG09246.1 hypothetical protein EGT29_16025 [Pigmentiphaga sp. H8]